MLKKLLFLSFFVLLAISFTSCDNSTNPDNRNDCNLSTDAGSDVQGYLITYTAEGTGDGKITKLTYIDNSGVQTVDNPELPWTKTFTFTNPDTTAVITAVGYTVNGSLSVKISGTTGVSNFSTHDDCSSSFK